MACLSFRRETERSGRINKRLLMGLTLISLAIGGVGYAAVQGTIPSLFTSSPVNEELMTVPVKRGELRVTVVETGNLDSASNVTISSQVKGSTKIIRIVPEGTHAYPGMTLVELDASVYQDNADQQKISLKQAESLRDQSEKALEIQETVNKSNIAAAKLAWDLAELDLEKYRKGDFERLRTELVSKITLAEEDLAQKLDKYAFSKRQSKKGYVNQNELEQARIGVTKAELDLKAAKMELHVLETYDQKRELAEREANAVEFKLRWERSIKQAEAAIEQAQADLDARKLTAKVENNKFQKLQEQIACCTIVAEQEGQVVYAASDSRRSNRERTIEAGATVDHRQTIIKLPDLSQMQVDTRIHESKIGLVENGMPVIVKVKAESDRFYEGVVKSVASVPNSPNWRQPDLREYAAVVSIVDEVTGDEILKPGLTAEVEIVSDVLHDVLKVPVHAIIARNGKFFLFVNRVGESPEIRQVYLGATNDIETEIREIESQDSQAKFAVGVKEGEEVVLAPRTALPTLYASLVEAEPEEVRDQLAGSRKKQSDDYKKSSKKGEAGDRKEPRKKQKPAETTAKLSKKTDKQLASILKQIDKNGDGMLTKVEVAETQLASRFDEMDTNSDGNVDQTELASATREFSRKQGAGGSQ